MKYPSRDAGRDRTKKQWHGPRFDRVIFAFMLVMFLLVIVITFSSGFWGPLIIAIDIWPIASFVIVVFLMRRQMADIWYSQRRTVAARIWEGARYDENILQLEDNQILAKRGQARY